MTTLQARTPTTASGRWLYPLLIAVQTLGVVIFYWKGLPLYRQVAADPSAFEARADSRVWALLAIMLIQVGYWIRYRVRPVAPRLSNALLGLLVLFWGRMSFILATAVFSLLFIAKKLESQLSPVGYFVTLLGLFSLFCYMLE